MAERTRGRLTVYLGMAAGVGKTYRMLADAQADLARGEDLVLAYLEPHGRPETEAQAEGIPVVPPKELEHNGIRLRELDLDAVLARAPAVTLVDELAHTNAPGSRHAKRWLDVEELLAAGIHVRTTLNVQHIESLRDVVAQITGVFVKETVPDRFFERADAIEVVDLSPEELHRRLIEGKVYPRERIEASLAGFFARGNLLALRELALRKTAEAVDEQMRLSRRLDRREAPWHASERVLVCVAPNRMADRVVREAARLASSLHGDLLGVTVDSPRQRRTAIGAAQVDAALRLVESLGGETALLAGDDIVAEILRYARAQNATTIVLGKPIRPRWREVLFGSVADTMIRRSGETDVLVITDEAAAGSDAAPRVPGLLVPEPGSSPSVARDALAGGVAVVGATLAGWATRSVLSVGSVAMLYVLAAAVVATRVGARAAFAVALAGAAAFNFFFIPPRYTLAVSDAASLVTLLVMLVVSALVSGLAGRARERGNALAERERATAALYELTTALNRASEREEMARLVVGRVQALLGASATVVVPGDGPRDAPEIAAGSADAFEVPVREMAVASWTLANGRPAGRHTDTLAGAAGTYLPLNGEEAVLGAIGIEYGEIPPSPTTRRFAEAIAAALAGAFERHRLGAARREESRKAEAERLRGDLLSSVSHDLRTPLAAIEGAASVLQDDPEFDPRRRRLAETIREEAERMARLVRDLLDMTRVQGELRLDLDWQALGEIVESAVARTSPLFSTPPRVESPDEAILMRADGVLLEGVFVNLLENAARHAGAGASVAIRLHAELGFAVAEIEDDGPGIPHGEEAAIFERFRRLGEGGFGLGLSIARAAVEAHGGRISAENRPQGGARFTVRLPRERAPERDS